MVTETVVGFGNAAQKKMALLNASITRYFMLSMLAGIYVGFGIILVFSIGEPLKSVGAAGLKAIMGASFGVALTLVIFAGSELFTGNNMIMTIGALSKKVSWFDTLKLWTVCYAGNLAGALLLSVLVQQAGMFQSPSVEAFISKAALAKGTGAFSALFFKGILCNMLVCLAVWTCARTTNDMAKIALIFWCLFAFIGSGFEHSVANMTVIGVGALVSDSVHWGHLWYNLLPVTLGNIVGGALFIGATYWFIASKELKGSN